MDSGRDKTRSFFGFFAAILVVFVVAAPIAQAVDQVIAQIRDGQGDKLAISNNGAAKVAGNVTSKVRSSQNDPISSEDEGVTCATHPASGCFGLTPVEAHQGAMNTKIYPGGAGILAAGSCVGASPTHEAVVQGNSIITGIIVTPDDDNLVELDVSAEALGGGIISEFRTTVENPYVALPLDTGLGTTSTVTFSCTGATGAAGTGHFLVLGTNSSSS